jgi:hypothetical protein
MGQTMFLDCSLLKSICLPPLFGQLDGRWMWTSGIDRVCIDSDNPYLTVCGDFLVTISGTAAVRYLGLGREVQISGTVERIAAGCFCACRTISGVTFAPGSQVGILGKFAFSSSSLTSICIPSSTETIGKRCFYACHSLLVVTFESGSRLSIVGQSAFGSCRSLRGICIPSSAKLFHDLVSLDATRFRRSDSKVVLSFRL